MFICANIAKAPVTTVIRALMPFLLTNILILFLVSYIPALSTWLPSLME
jgi:TRAP-type C4-dicarboxylate transport system permease large subunit